MVYLKYIYILLYFSISKNIVLYLAISNQIISHNIIIYELISWFMLFCHMSYMLYSVVYSTYMYIRFFVYSNIYHNTQPLGGYRNYLDSHETTNFRTRKSHQSSPQARHGLARKTCAMKLWFLGCVRYGGTRF